MLFRATNAANWSSIIRIGAKMAVIRRRIARRAVSSHTQRAGKVPSGESRLIRKDSKTSEEDQVATLDVVETYVPIPGNGEFAGAFEIYYDITGRMAKIDRLVFVSTIILVGVASGRLIVVFWTLSKAVSATMQRDMAEAALRESEERQADAIESLSDAFVLI